MSPHPGDDDADVLILGASLLGVELLYQLRRRLGRGRARVTVVDRQAEHLYIPLLHEVLTGRLRRRDATLRTRAYAESDPQCRYVVGEIVRFDPKTRSALLADGRRLRGRTVVVAIGSQVSPPGQIRGHERMQGLKFAGSVEAARAQLATAGSSTARQAVVVGGGISGVELAGELAHAGAHGRMAPMRVALVHGGGRLLEGHHPRAARWAHQWLLRQGVELHLGCRVVEVTPVGVALASEASTSPMYLPGDPVFWAGGVRPATSLSSFGLDRTDSGFLVVDPHLRASVDGAPVGGVFAGGDAVRVVSEGREWATMQRAIEAIWQAKTLARNLSRCLSPGRLPGRLVRHRERRSFPYGISVGAGSLIAFGPLVLDAARLNTWFRRFLMRRYLARYRPG